MWSRTGAKRSRAGRPALVWLTGDPPPDRQLRRDGFRVVRWAALLRAVRAARAGGTVRSSLANPAARLLRVFSRHARVAVLEVACRTSEDLRLLYGYVVEPGHRRGCELQIHADRALGDLDPAAFVDPAWRYPWSLERLLHLADNASGQPPAGRRPPVTPRPLRLDREQAAAVRAPLGVVQVIAPAGSGKTTVLVERVKELLHRGADARRVLCTTFNKDARVEIAARLARAGVAGIEVRSFHGLGWWILREERQLRPDIGGPSVSQWRRLAHLAMSAAADGVWVEPPAAQNAISAFKLSAMITPREALARVEDAVGSAGADALARTLARLYVLYEEHLADRRRLDFDDLIARAVRLLQEDAAVRRRWQGRFDHVLVDEYQDIEPAQALLVGLLAAPQDSLFCVGDEDQCIYAWRRAAVARVIELDQTYPGLVRFPLVRNYRCGKAITLASRRLIQHNRHRFRKPLHPGAPHRGQIDVLAFSDRSSGAAWVATALQGRRRGEIAVLARTSTLLREVALACAAAGVPFSAPARARVATGARRVLLACLQALADPQAVSPDDRELLRRHKLPFDGGLLEALATEPDAGRVIARLRAEGGLDAFFAEQEALNPTERTEIEFLAEAELAAAGCTVPVAAARLAAAEAAMQLGASEDGIELATIHGSKGREWDRVVFYGVDQGQVPHARSLAGDVATAQELATGRRDVAAALAAGLEDERRLFYVALTRAKHRLDIVCTRSAPSPFLGEAGLGVV